MMLGLIQSRFRIINEVIRNHARGVVADSSNPEHPALPLGVDDENMKRTPVIITQSQQSGTIKDKLLKKSNPSRTYEQADAGAGIYDGNPVKPEKFAHDYYIGEVL